MEAPQFPVFFNKQVTCVVGPNDDVHMPRVSNLLDYEGELAVVIGTLLPPCAGGPRTR
jgi:2-keto-4-pentenoate hydratase/2-oxohepta-3-ene-1,7-dioic acid hydratase in catechol pathway